MKPRTPRNASSKASHGLRSRHCAAARRPDVAARDPERHGRPARMRRGGSPAGWRGAGRAAGPPGPAPRAGRSRSARGSRRGRRAGGACAGRAARRASSGAPATSGKRARSMVAHRRRPPASADGPRQVVRVERRLALLRPAALVAADRAAVVAGDRPRRPAVPSSSSAAQMISSTTSVRPQVAQRVANRSPIETLRLDVAARRGGHALERRVEVADVRRPEDDLGEHPGQRARFERDARGAGGRSRRGRPSRPGRTGRRRRRRGRCGASIRAATRAGDGAGASRSKTGSENPGSVLANEARTGHRCEMLADDGPAGAEARSPGSHRLPVHRSARSHILMRFYIDNSIAAYPVHGAPRHGGKDRAADRRSSPGSSPRLRRASFTTGRSLPSASSVPRPSRSTSGPTGSRRSSSGARGMRWWARSPRRWARRSVRAGPRPSSCR